MNPKDNEAANYARKAAQGGFGSPEFVALSGLMCWDAVKYCGMKAGIINQAKYARLNAKTEMVSGSDTKVAGPRQMEQVEPGSVLGFFDGDTIIHAMIATGRGKAAGNKNDCVYQGANPVGWQVLDLAAGLQWGPNGEVLAPRGTAGGQAVTRPVWIHRRFISYLEFK